MEIEKAMNLIGESLKVLPSSVSVCCLYDVGTTVLVHLVVITIAIESLLWGRKKCHQHVVRPAVTATKCM